MQYVLKILIASCLFCARNLFCCAATEVDETVLHPVRVLCEYDNREIVLSANVANQLQTVHGFVVDMTGAGDGLAAIPLPAEYETATLGRLIAILQRSPEQFEQSLDDIISELRPENRVNGIRQMLLLANYLSVPDALLRQLAVRYSLFTDEPLEVDMPADTARIITDIRLRFSRDRVVNLSHMDLTKIPPFSCLPRGRQKQIIGIDLSNNRIGILAAGSLCKLPPLLRMLDLRGNPITRVERSVFDGVQRGLDVIGDENGLWAVDREPLRKEVKTESNLFRHARRLGARALCWTCDPNKLQYFLGLLIPVQLLLSAKYGHTKAWKFANIGFNAISCYKALKKRKFGLGIGFLLDSCHQLDGLTLADRYLANRFGIAPSRIIGSDLYNKLHVAALMTRFLPFVRRSVKELAWEAALVFGAGRLFLPNTFDGKFAASSFAINRLYRRGRCLNLFADRLYSKLDEWLTRTQNHVELA